MDNYASFIGEALEKTRCRECVPSWEEIQVLMGRQEMLCTVHYPGPGSCQLHISSHTTANEVRGGGGLSIISVSLSSLSLSLYVTTKIYKHPLQSFPLELTFVETCTPYQTQQVGNCLSVYSLRLSLSSARW